jgi:hypothetical protein
MALPRPCPCLRCEHHLRRDFPGATESCELDIVDRHPHGATLEALSECLGVSKERVRQLEEQALLRASKRGRRYVGADT